VRGKLGYMSPEQAAGDPIDRRSDVFALGVLLWEALAARRLFDGQTDGELLARVIRGDVPALEGVAPRVAPALVAVVSRALAHAPAERFATALEMNRSLEVAVRDAGVIVGADEVARAVAALVPARVNEHGGWLREADSAPAARDLLATKVGTLAVSVTRDPKSRTGLTSRQSRLVAAGLGAAALATLAALGGAWFGGHRDARESIAHGPNSASAFGTAAATTATFAAVASASVQLPAPQTQPAPPATTPDAAPVTVDGLAPKPRKVPVANSPARAGSLPLDPGTLNVVSSPSWATISLDGKVAGDTPLVLRDVQAGPHTLEARSLGDGLPQRRTVNVSPGTATRVEFKAE
jgi:serine/threonine-protein kinase